MPPVRTIQRTEAWRAAALADSAAQAAGDVVRVRTTQWSSFQSGQQYRNLALKPLFFAGLWEVIWSLVDLRYRGWGTVILKRVKEGTADEAQ